MSADWALQTAVRAHVLGDATLLTLLGDPPRVYDQPPRDAVFPFLTFGRAETRPLDADAPGALAHVLHLHVWSRYGGRKEVKDIIAALRASLADASLAVAGHALVSLRVTFTDVLRAPDGRTSQGILRLRAVTQAVG